MLEGLLTSLVGIAIEFGFVSVLRCCVLFSVVCVCHVGLLFFAVSLWNAWSLWGFGGRKAHTRASATTTFYGCFSSQIPDFTGRLLRTVIFVTLSE